MRRPRAGSRSGWRLVSGSLSTSKPGGRGVRSAATHSKYRKVPSESSAAFNGRSSPCCCISTSNHPLPKGHGNATTGKRIIDRLVQRVAIANLHGLFEAPPPDPHRRGSRLECACRSAESAREPSRLFESDRRTATRASPRAASASPACSRIRAVRHHAVERGQSMRDDRPVVLLVAGLDERSAAIDKYRRRSKRPSAPDTFPLDFRIVSEGAARRWRKAEIDRVAEVVTGETQPQANRVLADDTLNRAVHLGAPRAKTSQDQPTVSIAVRLLGRAMESRGPVRFRPAGEARDTDSTCRFRSDQ